MIKLSILLLLLHVLFSQLPAQQKPLAGKEFIEKALKEIKEFNESESRRDSIAGHPLGSHNEEDIQRRYQFYRSVHVKLDKLNKSSFSFNDEINLELLQYSIEDEISSYTFKTYLNPILSDEGFHTDLVSMAAEILDSKKEFEKYIGKLRDIPRYVEENIALMRKGIKLGICQPRAILNGYEATYEQHIVEDPEKSVFWRPFLQKPFAIKDDDWQNLKDQARRAIRLYAIKGFKAIKDFFDREYLPGARATVGVSHFPDGLAFYQERTKHYTTTDLSYEEIYQIGLLEVARIKKEMHDIVNEVKFTGTLEEFINYLRTDSKFYAFTPEQLLKEASYIAKKADNKLPMFFGKLPRQPYGVEPVPVHLAPAYTAGRYSGAPLGSKRAGQYWVNTYELKSRPLYALESLTLHEAVPGHHLQVALAKELTDLPEFRRTLYVNAFGEGWGLYCEFLGTEMGFYKDPFARFGKLTYEMWRACRLVLDVALHTKGWTREEAVNYLAGNTALSLHEVNTEINRYISWPGQALAYKMGELKIKELRKKAEGQLKEKFDIREFHDLILSRGTVTLRILEKMTEQYIHAKLKPTLVKKEKPGKN